MSEKKLLTVRAEAEEMDEWKDAAHIRRKSLSSWVRQVLSATAKATKEEDA